MRSFKYDPYLWVHLAGFFAVPLVVQLVWLGLSIGTPLSLFWLEFIWLAFVGIVPIFLMQWVRPFNIFSLLFICLKPESLTEVQQKILSIFKTKKHRILTIIAVVLNVLLLWLIYPLSPLASSVTSFLPQYRIFGLLIASIAFLLTNLFVQVPFSVLGVLLSSEQKFVSTPPYPVQNINQDFTGIGFLVSKILPVILDEREPQNKIPPLNHQDKSTQPTET